MPVPDLSALGAQSAPAKEANGDGALECPELASWGQTVLLARRPEGPT